MNQADTSVSQPFRSRRKYYQVITASQMVFILILIGTLLIVIKPIRNYLGVIDDPAMVIFPIMAYIPHTVSIIALLEIIKQLDKRNLSGDATIESFYSLFQTEPTSSTLVQSIRWMSIGIVTIVTAISWIFGILSIPFGDSLILSPMNMITLSLILSFLIVWFIYSIRIENNPAAGYLILLAVFNITINTAAIIVVGDILALPLTLSYQILALILILSRWLSIRIPNK